MKTRSYFHSCLPRARLGGLCLAMLAASYTSARAASADLPKLLEQAIYSEDSKGDLDSAMSLYKKILTEGAADQAIAAQAEYRLALCYEKKKDHAAAEAAFATIVRDFPSQKTYVALANEHLSAGLALEPAPWKDGEEMVLQVRASTGAKGGLIKYSIESGKVDGRAVWEFASHAFNGGSVITKIVADADTLKPLSSEVKSGKLIHITTKYGNGFAEIEGLGPTGNKHVELNGLFYDNEEVLELLRRLPLAIGYKVSLRIASGGTNGTIIPAEFSVAAKENVVTPAGTFEAFKITSSINLILWYSADTHKYLIKMATLGGGMELVSAGMPSTEPIVYHDKAMKFILTVPDGWLLIRQQDDADTKASTILAGDPDGLGSIMFKVIPGTEYPAEAKVSARAIADYHNKDGVRWYKDYKVRSDSWSNTKIAGQPAVECTIDAVNNSGFPLAIVDNFTVIDDKGLDFELLCDQSDVAKLKETYESIKDSFRFE